MVFLYFIILWLPLRVRSLLALRELLWLIIATGLFSLPVSVLLFHIVYLLVCILVAAGQYLYSSCDCYRAAMAMGMRYAWLLHVHILF